MPQTPQTTFSGNPLNRAAHKRRDKIWIAKQLANPKNLILPFWKEQPLIIGKNKPQLGFIHPGLLNIPKNHNPILLGLNAQNHAHFALALPNAPNPEENGPLAGLGRFDDLRNLALQAALPPADLAIAAQARALLLWTRSARFCGYCAHPLRSEEAGYKKICEECGAEIFPRADPVVIMLATLNDKAFLGRQKTFPPGFYSAPAGFVEPGESLEEAVRRELWEEARLSVKTEEILYHASQPWPYPHSLMIGCAARAEKENFYLDGEELEEARWFSKDELRQMIRPEGCAINDKIFRAPPKMAIAYDLIQNFLQKN